MALEQTRSTADAGSMNVVQFRIERGDRVVGTDGPLGSVEHLVVMGDAEELRSLIVRERDSTREVELPASLIVRTLGHQVELCIGRAELAAHPELATPYDPSQYQPVFEGTRMPELAAGQVSAQTDRPVVTGVEPDAAALVSARADLAPEGEVEALPARGQGDDTAAASASAPAGDRVVEPPRVVPVSETAPATEAAPTATVPPGEDVMMREAPPMPVERQLPPAAEESPRAEAANPEVVASEGTAVGDLTEPEVDDEETAMEEIAMMEEIEPLFVTEEELEPIAGIPWGAVLGVVAMTAAGVAGLAVWRARSRVRCAAATQGSRLVLRLGRWQMRRQLKRRVSAAGSTFQNAIDAVRRQGQQMTARWRRR